MKNNAIMVVLLAPATENICESFIHNPLARAQGKPTFLSLIGIHKECITNAIKLVSDFGGGQHSCACIVMVKQQHILHSNIAFLPPRKPRSTL